jgi:hypothetical protein
LTTEQPTPPPQGGQEGQKDSQPQLIAVASGDESVAKLQLAARWAERYAPRNADSMSAALRRFRQAYDYLDAVTHGIEPPSDEESGERS